MGRCLDAYILFLQELIGMDEIRKILGEAKKDG